jgi:hypothetical protein
VEKQIATLEVQEENQKGSGVVDVVDSALMGPLGVTAQSSTNVVRCLCMVRHIVFLAQE